MKMKSVTNMKVDGITIEIDGVEFVSTPMRLREAKSFSEFKSWLLTFGRGGFIPTPGFPEKLEFTIPIEMETTHEELLSWWNSVHKDIVS